MLLSSHPECRSDDTAEMEGWLISNLGGTYFAVERQRASFLFDVNMARLSDVALLWSNCNVATQIGHAPMSYLCHIFPIRKSSQVILDGKLAQSPTPGSGYFVPNDIPWRIDREGGFQNLSLHAQPDALMRKLQAMTGLACNSRLEFRMPAENDSNRMKLLRNSVFQFAHELDAMGVHLPPLAMREMEQSILVRFLLCHRHNYSDLLEQQPTSSSMAQLKRAKDYMVANWDKPLEIEKLVAVTGTSTRSIFRGFQRLYGCSPQALLKKVRLERARAMLLEGGSGTSVMMVAMQCGFQSLGHFARSYRDLFHELPSETRGGSNFSIDRGA